LKKPNKIAHSFNLKLHTTREITPIYHKDRANANLNAKVKKIVEVTAKQAQNRKLK